MLCLSPGESNLRDCGVLIQCHECQGTFNMKRNGTCQRCPITGAVCPGGNANGEVSSEGGVSALRGYYGFYDDLTDSLSMFQCPIEQCCQHDTCAVYGGDDCPASRNVSCPLCGKCNQGLSETLGSVNCKECSDTEWWLIMAFAVLLAGVYFYLRYTAISNSESSVLQVVVTKSLLYFYQTVPLLLPSHSVHSSLDALLTTFTMNPSSGGGEGVCIVPGLDAMGKLLLPLYAAAWLNVLAIGCIGAALCSKYFRSQDEQLSLTEVDGSSEHPSISQPSDSVQVAQATLWLVALYQYSTVSQVALKLVACRTFGGERLSYYAPVYKCYSSYNGWQYGAFLLVAAVSFFPVVVMLVVKHDKSSNLARPFSTKFCLYEGVLMSRRLILIATYISLPISNELRQALLTCGCILVLFIQMHCQPFKDDQVNLCESILLTLLVIIATMSFTLAAHEVHCTLSTQMQ